MISTLLFTLLTAGPYVYPEAPIYDSKDKPSFEEWLCISARRFKTKTSTDTILCTDVEKDLWGDATFLMGELHKAQLLAGLPRDEPITVSSTSTPDIPIADCESRPLIDFGSDWLIGLGIGILTGVATTALIASVAR